MKMDTSVASINQTSLVQPLTKATLIIDGYSDYCDNLDSRLYELAEQLVAMVDEDEDYSDSEDFSTEMDFGTNPSENLEAERLLLSDSYSQCMEEALRFLIQEEGFPQNHEMVIGLQRHLEAQKTTAVERAVIKTQPKHDRIVIRGPAT